MVQAELPDIDLNFKWSLHQISSVFKLPLCDVREPVPPSEELLHSMKDFSGLSEDDEDTKHLAAVAFLYLYCCINYKDGQLSPVHIVLSSKLPPGAGLGSSAAYSTCLSAAFLHQMGHLTAPSQPSKSWSDEDLKLINGWAFQAERIIHGNPSGIDNSVSCYGGALRFQSGIITPLAKMPTLTILLFNTKVPRSTKNLVAGVRTKYNKYVEIITPLLTSIEAICDHCERLLQQMADTSQPSENHSVVEHYQSLQELLSMNHQLLSILGVSHPSLECIRGIVSSHDLQCKLTGAGGGGCAFSIIPPGFSADTINIIKKKIGDLGYDCWQTQIGGAGVTVHHDVQCIAKSLPECFKL